ncbi:MAG: DUF2652 domain-containing protein [Bacteroidota bacterium]
MNKSLLLIADISGFTDFVHSTEIEHSRHITSELLEAMIDSDALGMEVAEIEGDAVLFFKYHQLPSQKELLAQAEKMFLDFHNHLQLYKLRRICNCGACSTAENLTMKIVAHASDFEFMKVKNFKKPHGNDLIVIHKLLKNNIEGREYLLMTDQLIQEIGSSDHSEFPWAVHKEGSIRYEKLGEINYHYLSLTPLKSEVKIPEKISGSQHSKNPLRVSTHISVKKQKLFDILNNFDERYKWNKGLLKLEYERDRVNRAGTVHKCVLKNGDQLEFETVKGDFPESTLVYGERLKDFKFFEEVTNYYILKGEGEGTHITVESHIKAKSFLHSLLMPMIKMQFNKNFKQVLKDLKELVENKSVVRNFAEGADYSTNRVAS